MTSTATTARRLIASLGTTALLGVALVGALSAPAGADSVGGEAAFRTAWATAGTTQIDLTADITLTCVDNEPTRNSATAIAVNGNGHTLSQTCSGDRVLVQEGSGSIDLVDLTLTGGITKGDGGGVESGGDVAVEGSVLTGNHADGEGGAIRTSGTVDITDSAVTDNTADGSGGALSVSGPTTLASSTVSGNTSGNNGGAVRAYGGATVIDSTLSGNSADSDGGAISSNVGITLVYATITGNTANGGGNLDVSGDLTSFGSVVAEPNGDDNCAFIESTVTTGYNLDDDGSCGFGAGPGDRSNFSDPLELGALADNGGVGQTRLPAATSPLVDQIPAAACAGGQGITVDQRGITRPQGTMCDVGAVEVSVAVTPTTTTPTATNPTPVEAAPAFTG